MTAADRVVAEMRAAIDEARAERANLRDAIRDAKQLVPAEVERQVHAALHELHAETRLAMEKQAVAAIDEIRLEWRRRLGLT